MMEVKFYDLGYCDEKEYTRVVCLSRYKNKYLFCYNKNRKGWEIPGGHIETGENWQDAAKREMYEETGAKKISLYPISVYKINSFAVLCYCEILEMGELPPEHEMSDVMLSDGLPSNLTYPETYKLFFEKAKENIRHIARS